MPVKTKVAHAVYRNPVIFKTIEVQGFRNLITIVEIRNHSDFQNK